jgi:hypothetical protein
MQLDLFDRGPHLGNPVAHAADPETSHEAGEAVTRSGARGRQAAAVLALVRGHPGRTAAELVGLQVDFPRLDVYQVRRRLTDLLHAGLVVQGEARPCSRVGSRMVTWTAREDR